jgi:hypothetical protein
VNANVSTMTDADLEVEASILEAIDEPTDEQFYRALAIEREQDARALWNSDDDRIREAVGHYREDAQ